MTEKEHTSFDDFGKQKEKPRNNLQNSSNKMGADRVASFYEAKFQSEDYGKKTVYLNPDRDHYHQKILGKLKDDQTILDVGCATGYLGKAAKQRYNNVKVYGIEISEWAAAEAEKVLDGVVLANIENLDLPLPEQYFDVIICSDILEHLFDPETTLIKLRKHLKPNGKLMASIPNVAYWRFRWMLLRGKWQYEKELHLDYGHIRFFTKTSAVNLLESTGYEVEDAIPWIELPFLIGYADGKLLNRLLSRICSHFGASASLFAVNFLFVAKLKQ